MNAAVLRWLHRSPSSKGTKRESYTRLRLRSEVCVLEVDFALHMHPFPYTVLLSLASSIGSKPKMTKINLLEANCIKYLRARAPIRNGTLAAFIPLHAAFFYTNNLTEVGLWN